MKIFCYHLENIANMGDFKLFMKRKIQFRFVVFDILYTIKLTPFLIYTEKSHLKFKKMCENAKQKLVFENRFMFCISSNFLDQF